MKSAHFVTILFLCPFSYGMDKKEVVLAIGNGVPTVSLQRTDSRGRRNTYPQPPTYIHNEYKPSYVLNVTPHETPKDDDSYEVKPTNSFCSKKSQIFLMVGMATACCTGIGGIVSAVVTLVIHFTS